MYAMQYGVTLPADYDMKVIRDRVAGRGRLTDAYEGLGFKAYLIRERGTDGSPVNEYAPFYLWDDTGGMNRFLWGGGGFGGIVADFGRPDVSHWTGVAHRPGPAFGAAPAAASRLRQRMPAGADPRGPVARALEAWEERAATPGVHTAVLGVDPRHWETVLFTLWERTPPAGVTDPDRYEVLHLSAPHLHEVSVGRQWP
ncbi:DUF4865 family protein [Actinacidiphila glaucinigra]|uniref:DUF4865 family protein n=1 Tax=Actinacidiphila glaucinigra TaxID=235986 RepID=UPI00340AD987